MKTAVKFEANSPLVSPNTAVSTAPVPTAARKPRVSMTYAAGRKRITKTTIKTIDSSPIIKSEA
jgi:hypothetical protein